MKREEKLEKIIAYIKEGEKKDRDFYIGFEAEHFVVDRDSLESECYYGDKGVLEALKDLIGLGYEPSYDKGMLLALRGYGIDISIEPAGQFELAINAQKSVDDLFEIYKDNLQRILPVFEKRNQLLLCLGYQVKSSIDDLKILDKPRYKCMYRYFDEYGGSMGHNMMKGSASLQFAVDYFDEEDFKKKYFLANALSPFLYSIFDNSPIFEGEKYHRHNLRQTIWENTDKDRVGIFDFSLDKDLTYKKYAEKILTTPMIFKEKGEQTYYMGTKTLEEEMTEANAESLVEHGLSIVFPDVRVKKYLEIRAADQVTYPYNMGALSLIKGIFSNRDLVDDLYNKYSSMTYDKAQALKKEATSKGIFAKYEGKEIYLHMLEIIYLVRHSLDQDESKYLDPVEEILRARKVPRDVFEELYDEDPKRAAYEFSLNKFVDELKK